LLETFFTDRLIAQRRVSPHTVASYRDTFRLLLKFAQKELGKSPSKLALTDLNAPLIGTFLDSCETKISAPRGIGPGFLQVVAAGN
jgi:integrase/recombinase XerD